MQHTNRTSRRRAFVAVICVLGVFAAFVIRLIDIQVVNASQLQTAASDKTSGELVVYGERGDIVDSEGEVLAGSVMRYDLSVAPVNVNEFTRTDDDGSTSKVSVEQAASELGDIIGVSGKHILDVVAGALEENENSLYARIAKSIDVDKYRAVEALDIPWLYAKQHPARFYPNGAVAGNIIGFVGSDQSPLAGVERYMNSCLKSQNGTQAYQRGKDGVAIPGSMQTTQPAENGGTVKLTLDADLQWYAQQRLAEQVEATNGTWGIVTVMEAKTGKLKAVAEYPSVDPTDVASSNPADRGARAFTTPYEPGSTFKTLLAASLIDAGLADPTTHVVADGWYYPSNGAEIRDSFPHGPMNLTLTGVLAESSNTGISQLGERMSAKDRYEYLQKFGIGTETSVGFPGESSGVLHPWKNWDNQTFYATMFGQGLTSTAIQDASAYQTLANGGVRLPVQLVEGCVQPDGTVTNVPSSEGTRVVSENAADLTVQMLESVPTDGHFGTTLQIPGYRVAAKSGTAQQGDGQGGLKSTYIVSMTGMAPADDPEYVVSVTIANPTTIRSSAAAAPTFQQVMTQVLKSYDVPPSTEPAPNWPTRF
ncbi:peptidoglycan D,D-transpeptidase FtsI family protein [Paramicrobacterium agarici]|uniref:peptidoglycan D,D-transpeptidase FtsI family protein n=1 Tax=Paramicrobacterium agarici TaxID=630514 RepID=UPI00116A51D7|nr:penicillin-binding protein 2 [Microbacterium agarici]TQO21344.1 cell division protein FtsI (penicillin-binding protein 3) [Microbacterium agarici]